MRVLPYGERALLVDVADHHEALALYEDLRADPVDGLLDLVPAARTLLAVFEDDRSARSAVAAVAARRPVPKRRDGGPLVEVPVTYDGEDLAAVAELTGLSVPEVVARHQGSECVVAFIGFAPGFAYLAGLDEGLHVPRRTSPRTRVPAGSVAMAGEFTAVYPRESPGGWQLIGRTDLALWSLDRDPPALLLPGTRIRFRQVGP